MQKPHIYRRSKKYLAVQNVAEKNWHMDASEFKLQISNRTKKAAKKPKISPSSEKS